MKKKLVSFLVGCLLISCVEKVKYEAPVFTERIPENVRILNDDYIFKYGDNPMLVDSLLIVSTFNDDQQIAVFNRNSGRLLKDFGKKGPAPFELVTPTAFSVDKLEQILYVSDIGKQSLLSYDLREVINENMIIPVPIKTSQEFMKRSLVRFLRDSLYFAPAHKDGRILVGVPMEIQYVIDSKTPDSNKFPTQEDWYNYMNMQSVMVVRPDGHYLAAGSSLGGILEVFDLNSDNKERVVLKHFYEPIFKKKGHVVRPIPETIGGFSYLAATDKFLYATLHGKANPNSMPSSICKFDWKGNPIERYDCGKYSICSFVVSEDDRTVYAVAVDGDGEQILLEIHL